MIVPLVQWSQEQLAQLEQASKHHPKPYVREKCAALLKLGQGRSCREVGQTGLLTRHAGDTLAHWAARYQQEGLEGLLVQTGRGRKPAFSPSGPER